MRQPRHEDVHAVARALLSVAEHRRTWVMRRIFREADLAMASIRNGASAHPKWGEGSLMSAALRRKPIAAPSLSDPEFCRCLAQVYQAIASRGD